MLTIAVGHVATPRPRLRRARLLAGLVLAVAASLAQAAYVLAVVPQSSPAALHRQWGAFAERLKRDSGIDLQLRLYPTFAEFETELARGIPDLVYLNPYQQLAANKRQGYLPLVRGSRTLTGLLVVRNDSPVRSLRDLNDREIVFPQPNAFGASLYLRALLEEKEKIRFHARFLSTHANVYRHVILGRAAAGGGVNLTLEREYPETRRELRVLYQTPPTAPHPLSAHPRMPPEWRAAVIAAVLRMRDDADGRALLERVDLAEPVRADQMRDYRPLERLRLGRYQAQNPLPPQ